jgi:type II secretory pathway component GspD/PulD (secretin)
VVTLNDVLWEDVVTVTDIHGNTERRVIRKTYQVPTSQQKEFYARIRVPDRGTVIIAGLSQATTSSREGGVPILINMPFLKRLFGAKTDTELRTHDVFLATTTILLPDEIERSIPRY